MRVGVIHRSASLASVLAGILRSEAGVAVAWSSGQPEEAIARSAAEPVDVILLHAEVGAPGAVETTRRLVSASGAPVIVVTDSRHPDPGVVFEAMGAGAIDVAESPGVSASGQLEGVERLLRKLHAAASLSGAVQRPRASGVRAAAPPTGATPTPSLVAIGASTGGPSALVTVLGALPPSFNVPIVVIQHVDAKFSGDLAQWLGQSVRLPVVLARRGGQPEPGTIVLTATNDDLVMTPARQFAFSPPEDGSFYHPSVDVFFSSAARHWPTPGVAVLLTGIGRDGASGMKTLRDRGWHTIAQDKNSSVVYGMPRAAAELGAAAEVLPLDRIAGALQRALGVRVPD